MPMPTYRSTNYSLIYATLAVVVICVLSITGRGFLRPAVNNMLGGIELRKFKSEFQDLPHPAGTERLSLRTAKGVLTAGDTGCDLFVGEVRQFDGNEEVICAAYTDQTVRGNPIQVAFFEYGQLPAQASKLLPEPLNDLAGWDLPLEAGEQPLYMVYIEVVGFEGKMHLNCR